MMAHLEHFTTLTEKESETEILHVSKLLPPNTICHLCGVQVSVLGDKTLPQSSHVILLKQGFLCDHLSHAHELTKTINFRSKII